MGLHAGPFQVISMGCYPPPYPNIHPAFEELYQIWLAADTLIWVNRNDLARVLFERDDDAHQQV